VSRAQLRRLAVLVAVAALISIVVYVSLGPSRSPARSSEVVLATAGIESLDHAYGQALAQAGADRLGTMRVLASGGARDNLDLLRDGAANFALVTADVASSRPPGPIRSVARLYDTYVHLVARADLAVHRPHDLRGLRVSVGSAGSGTAIAADRILEAAGIDPTTGIERSQLSVADAVAALRTGQIDAFFASEALGSPVMSRLAEVISIRLVDLGDVANTLRGEPGSRYLAGNVPAGTYPWLAVPIVTLAVPTLLLTTEATDEALVREMTGLLFDSAPGIAGQIPAVGQVDRHSAIFTGTVPLHAGARDYYLATKLAV
jgi:TRAP transporter TAXI family solute receptor